MPVPAALKGRLLAVFDSPYGKVLVADDSERHWSSPDPQVEVLAVALYKGADQPHL